MGKKTKFITLCALMTAYSVVALFVGSVLPTGQLGFAALASLFGIAAVIEMGIKGGVSVFICSLILGLLLTSNKNPAILYGMFFGYYPILKFFAEKVRIRPVEWIIKLAVLNIALTLIVVIFNSLVFSVQSLTDSLIVIYLGANVVFVVFDLGVTRAMRFYISKLSVKHRNRGWQ